MNIKAIITDLDGTLLTKDKMISDYSVYVIDQCRKKGIKFAIATGRSELACKRFIDIIKPDALITNDGSVIIHDNKNIHSKPIPVDICNDIIKYCFDELEMVDMTVDMGSGYLSNSKTMETWADFAYYSYDDLKNPLKQDCLKIVVNNAEDRFVDKLKKRFPECSIVSFSKDNWVRIAYKDVSKMYAINILANHFNIDVGEIVAFGDDNNDVEMIDGCGVGVAVENAIQPVKNVANYICKSNNENGVADWLNTYVLKG